MTILEAGLNDAACVLSNVGGCAEIIEDCVDGFLVDPTDLDGYYDKIATLIENGELRNTMAGKLKRKVASKYSPNSIIDQYEDLYKQTIVS